MLPSGSYQPWEIAWLDGGNEVGRAQGYSEELNAGNFVAQSAKWDTFLGAADALTLGARLRDRFNDETTYTVAQPTNGAAREFKLLVQCRNNVSGRKFNFTIPTLNPAAIEYVININAQDVLKLDSPSAVVDFIDATEAFVRDPNQPASAITVIGLKAVGRNN